MDEATPLPITRRTILNQVADLIKKQYTGSRVLLFGSSARGDDNAESDIDLCIIVNNPEERLIEISRKIRKVAFPLLHKGMDILVYDKETFKERAALSLTMEAEIVEQAVEL